MTEMLGMEVKFLPDGSSMFTVVHLKKEKDVVSIVSSKSHISIQECIEALPKDLPVSLCFSGKGIICKKVELSEAGLHAAVTTLVPNANTADFAYNTDVYNNDVTVALIRRSRIEEVLQQLIDNKIYPISLGLEFIPLLKFKTMVGVQFETFTINGYLLTFSDEGLKDFEVNAQNNENLKVGDTNIPATNVIAYATAFVTLIDPQELSDANLPQIQQSHAEFLEKKLFKFSLICTLVAILVILVVNAIAFTNQFSKNETLQQQSYRFKGKTEDIKKEEIALLEKENFLKQNGWLHKSTLSFMCDKLAATVPGSITLKELDINPLVIDNTQAIKKSNFTDKKVTLKGRCYKSADLSNWIQILKHLNWISDVQMVDYNHDHSNNSAVFNLEITYNIE